MTAAKGRISKARARWAGASTCSRSACSVSPPTPRPALPKIPGEFDRLDRRLDVIVQEIRRNGNGHRRLPLATLTHWWERLAPWIAGVAVILFLLMGAVMLYQQNNLRTFTQDAHQHTAAQSDEILRVLNEHTDTLKEVTQLRQEVTALVNEDGPKITAGQNLLLARLTWIECAVAAGPASCGARP